MILGDLYNTLFVGLYWKPPEQPYLTMTEEGYTLQRVEFKYNKETQYLMVASLLFGDTTSSKQLLLESTKPNYYSVSHICYIVDRCIYESQRTWYNEWTFAYVYIMSDVIGNMFLTQEDKDRHSKLDKGVYTFKNKLGVAIQWEVI